jgi:hypothetical protein
MEGLLISQAPLLVVPIQFFQQLLLLVVAVALRQAVLQEVQVVEVGMVHHLPVVQVIHLPLARLKETMVQTGLGLLILTVGVAVAAHLLLVLLVRQAEMVALVQHQVLLGLALRELVAVGAVSLQQTPPEPEVQVVVETAVLVTAIQDKLLVLLTQAVVVAAAVTILHLRLEPTAALVSLSSKSHLRTMPHSHLV